MLSEDDAFQCVVKYVGDGAFLQRANFEPERGCHAVEGLFVTLNQQGVVVDSAGTDLGGWMYENEGGLRKWF